MEDVGLVPAIEQPVEQRETFEHALRGLINSYSKENGSNTPDFLLAEYLNNCLEVFNNTLTAREKWYGRDKVHPITGQPIGGL